MNQTRCQTAGFKKRVKKLKKNFTAQFFGFTLSPSLRKRLNGLVSQSLDAKVTIITLCLEKRYSMNTPIIAQASLLY